MPPAGRPRDAAREQVILAAALDLVAEHGYEHVSVETVARRAGASKATIYRRWTGKRDLVLAAVLARQGGELPEIDTGGLRTDLLALCRRLASTLLQSQPALIVALLQATSDDPRLGDQIERAAGLTGARLPPAVLARAVARGELPAGADPYVYEEVAGSVLTARALKAYPMGDAQLAFLVDGVLLPALRASVRPPPGPAVFASSPD